MKVALHEDISHQHAATVASGVLPLSVLATPRAQRADEVYELSDNARAVLAKVLQKDLPADDV